MNFFHDPLIRLTHPHALLFPSLWTASPTFSPPSSIMCTKFSYQFYSFLLFYPSVLTRVILYIHTYIHVLLSAHYSYLMYRVRTWFLYSSLWFTHRYSLPTFFTAKERLAILLFNPPHTSNSFPIFSNYTSNFFSGYAFKYKEHNLSTHQPGQESWTRKGVKLLSTCNILSQLEKGKFPNCDMHQTQGLSKVNYV